MMEHDIAKVRIKNVNVHKIRRRTMYNYLNNYKGRTDLVEL